MRSSYAKINIRRNEERTYNVVIKHMDETEWFEIADRAVNIVINNDTNGGCEVVAACRNFSRPDFGGCVPPPSSKIIATLTYICHQPHSFRSLSRWTLVSDFVNFQNAGGIKGSLRLEKVLDVQKIIFGCRKAVCHSVLVVCWYITKVFQSNQRGSSHTLFLLTSRYNARTACST